MADRQKFNFGIPAVLTKPQPVTANASSSETADSSINAVVDMPKRIEKNIALEQREKHLFDIKYILRSKIRENKKNRYPKEKLDNMKESILNYGLQQNLTAIYLEDDDVYVLEAGHTRTRALDELIAEFTGYEDETDESYQLYKKNVEEYKLKGYPCKISSILTDGIKYDFDDDTDLSTIPEAVIDSEIRLIITNEVNRNRTPATIAENVERLQKLYQRKNQGKKRTEKINVANQIAENLNITERQVLKYSSLQNLIPELKAEFDKNNITLTDSSNYAKLSEDEQRNILALLQSGQKVSSEEVTTLLREKNELAKKLAAKEEKIKLLENEKKETIEALANTNDDEQSALLESKDSEIELLKQELDLIKAQQEKASRTSFNKDQALLVKSDLTTRTAFDNAKKSIRDYIDAADKMLSLINPLDNEAKAMGTITDTDIRSQTRQLIELLERSLDKGADNK